MTKDLERKEKVLLAMLSLIYNYYDNCDTDHEGHDSNNY